MNNYPFVSKKAVGKLKDAQINNYNKAYVYIFKEKLFKSLTQP